MTQNSLHCKAVETRPMKARSDQKCPVWSHEEGKVNKTRGYRGTPFERKTRAWLAGSPWLRQLPSSVSPLQSLFPGWSLAQEISDEHTFLSSLAVAQAKSSSMVSSSSSSPSSRSEGSNNTNPPLSASLRRCSASSMTFSIRSGWLAKALTATATG